MNSKIKTALLIAAVLFIAGCTSTAMPSLTITSPLEGQAIVGTTITVSLSATGVTLAAPNGTIVPGEGHFHVWLDDKEQRGPQTTFTYEDVAIGQHTIRVELHKGDHLLIEGTAKSITFNRIEPNNQGTPPPPQPPGQLPPVSTVAVKEFNMTAKRFSFEPSTITVKKGDRIVLNIKSLDVEHGFSLATYDIVETLPVGQTKTITFTADEVGEFNFFCSVFCGSGHGDMRGKLIVTA